MSTIDTLIEQARTIDSLRIDFQATGKNVFMDDYARLTTKSHTIVKGTTDPISSDPAPVHLATHALGQFADKLGISYGRAFFNNNPTIPLVQKANLFNHFLSENQDKNFLFRTFEGYARGVLSDKYLIMDHEWVLQQARNFMTGPGGQLFDHVVLPNYRMDADLMSVTIIVTQNRPDDRDGPYGYGVNIRNGSVGNSSTAIASAFKRTSCNNSVYYRDIAWAIRHIGSAKFIETRASMVISALGEALQASEELVNAMIRARRQNIPNVFDVISGFTKAQGFNEDLNSVIAAGTEQQENLFGFVNGLSYAAHAAKDIDDNTREDLSALSGLILRTAANGETEGDALAKQLFALSGTRAHLAAIADD